MARAKKKDQTASPPRQPATEQAAADRAAPTQDGGGDRAPAARPALVILPRDGAPPLRLRASLAHRLPAQGDAPEIALWAREPVGWAVSVRCPRQTAAASFDDLDAAARWLEALAQADMPAAAGEPFAAKLAARQARQARERAIGAALEGWPPAD